MTIPFDRRHFLAASVGAIAAAALPARARAAAGSGAVVPPAPVARVEPARDIYFGETLSDPYRWMENDKDRDWLPFLQGQNLHARAVLDALPARAALLARIRQLSGDTVLTSRVQRAGGLTFIQQRPLGADNYKLIVRDNHRDRILIDPTTLGGGQGHVSVDWWRASPDGRHVVYGLSRNGSEDSVLQIITVADGRVLPERIENTQAANPSWLDDGTGFFYNQLTGAVDTPERFLDSQARFHRLRSDPAADPLLMKRGLVAGIDYERIQAPYIVAYAGARHVLLALADVRREFCLFSAPLADVLVNRARWTRIAGFEDEVTAAEIDGEDLYIVANRSTPRGRLVKTPIAAPNLATAAQVVPQGPAVIEDIARARDGLYLKIMDGGISRLSRLDRGGRVAEIVLPFEGTVGSVFASHEEDGVLISLAGWLAATGIWSVESAGGVRDTGITPKPDIDVSAYETKRSFATARDGTKIPYTLIYRRGRKLDGSAPAFISAYGSYGSTPTRRTSIRALWRSSMPARSWDMPTCAEAASTAANGIKRDSSPTSRTPGAI